MGAGIGAGIAYSLKAPKMVVFSAVVAGFVGAYAAQLTAGDGFTFISAAGRGIPGNPVNALLCAIVAVEIGNLIHGKTKLDILVVPLVSLLVAGLVAVSLGRPIDWLIGTIGSGINAAAEGGQGGNLLVRLLTSLIISVSMGLLITSPFSSAAIGVAIGLSGPAAAAAVAGCCAHMVGFATASFRDNKWGGVVPQGLGTSMLQMPNVFKKPRIILPAVIASVVGGPVAVLVFGLHSDPVGSGMGTAGLVGVIQTVMASWGEIPAWRLFTGVALVCFVLPVVITLLVSEFMRKKGWIKPDDMKLKL